MVHAIKMGWIQPRRPRDLIPQYYDLWAQEDPNTILGRHKMHVPAPKLALPGHAESYNPPPEYLLSEEEVRDRNPRAALGKTVELGQAASWLLGSKKCCLPFSSDILLSFPLFLEIDALGCVF